MTKGLTPRATIIRISSFVIEFRHGAAVNAKRETPPSRTSPADKFRTFRWLAATVLARFRTANHEFAAEEFLVVQFLHCALRLFDRLHLDEREAFRTLVMAIAHYFSVLDVADAVE